MATIVVVRHPDHPTEITLDGVQGPDVTTPVEVVNIDLGGSFNVVNPSTLERESLQEEHDRLTEILYRLPEGPAADAVNGALESVDEALEVLARD